MKVGSWLRQVGDTVQKFDPIAEMETDKVTVEVEAPEDGVLAELHVAEGDEVQPGQLLASLRVSAAAAAGGGAPAIHDRVAAVVAPSPPSEIVLSPAVKRFVKQHAIDVTRVIGTGRGNRVTLDDVRTHHAVAVADGDEPVPSAEGSPEPGSDTATDTGRSRLVAHTGMRRAIAQHLTDSLRQAPHVTSVFELDVSAIAAHRKRHLSEFAERGVKLTFTAYFVAACARALRTVPQINSRWHDDAVELFDDINIGIGTALGDDGLVVPVIKEAHTRNLFGIAQSLQAITARARDNALTPADLAGGTFTISNHGVNGSLFATPIIINQPQAAILGIGAVEKRVVVREVDGQDLIAIRPMAYVSLTIDHRVVDGYQTDRWLSEFTSILEHWETER
ncbi:MAG: 2-oxo acid dehydrogenase subunit E2 [Actinomycetota bacterium]